VTDYYATIARRLSGERLAPYLLATNNDLDAALALYQWNTTVAAAFWADLGHLEVILRNALHERLTEWSTPNWYVGNRHLFTDRMRSLVDEARLRARRAGYVETPGRVVAELNFGFWRYLLAARYERSLWRPCLYRAFPGNGRRRDVHDAVAALHQLRNRIAHHEPIYNRPLGRYHDTALAVAGWICPDTRQWIQRQSPVPATLARRP
jgi:hypothetical protein